MLLVAGFAGFMGTFLFHVCIRHRCRRLLYGASFATGVRAIIFGRIQGLRETVKIQFVQDRLLCACGFKWRQLVEG